MGKVWAHSIKRCAVLAIWLLAGTYVAAARVDEMSDAEQLKQWAHAGLDSLEWGLLLEAEGAYAETGGDSGSDLVLATVEFTMDAAVNDWLSGHVGLLWEEDDTEENNLDEAFITVGNAFYAQAGRFYLPVGNFESAFLSDPLTLELAEINKSSVMVGYANEWFDVSVGAFKGDVDGGATNTVIEDCYAAINFAPSEMVQLGAYYLSDILETDTLSESGFSMEADYEKQGGAGAYLNVFVGPAMFNAELVTALDEVSAGKTPMAYNLEASVGFMNDWTAGIKYEESEDIDLYEAGCGAVIFYGFHENAAVGLEYMRLQPEDKSEDDTDLVTVQLTLEF